MASNENTGGRCDARRWATEVRLSDGVHTVEAREVTTYIGVISYLAVRRNDGAEIRGWDDLQRVKNEVAGPERLAVEFYPPQEHVINLGNVRHLWVLPPGWVVPIGMSLDGSRPPAT